MSGATRRGVLTAIAGTPLLGCAPLATKPAESNRGFSRKPWAAPRVTMNNVIREIVGHRPYRPAGFVVKGERFDNKFIVHNYGHGGGGISLAWGSSALAVRELGTMPAGEVAVIGSGVMGLTSARLLQDAGWKVTIYTREVARHTTSNVAGGQWAPFGVYDPNVATQAFTDRLDWAARVSHHAYVSLGGTQYGVRWIEQYELADQPLGPFTAFASLFSYTADLEPGQHPFGAYHARRSVTMQIEPATFLRRLIQDFQIAGGGFVIRNFADISEVLAISEAVIYNCTGLGAAALFGDVELTPVKGQLVFLPPDPAVDYMTIGGGRGMLYMFPRSDVLLLGGTYKPGDYSTDVEPEETERIVEEHQRLFSTFD